MIGLSLMQGEGPHVGGGQEQLDRSGGEGGGISLSKPDETLKVHSQVQPSQAETWQIPHSLRLTLFD